VLTGRYGRSPFGEPRYRLVWAPARLEQSGGEWVDWNPGTPVSDRGKAGATPWRRRPEMRWTRKYPGEECWLIERWAPPSSYGSPEQWYRPVAAGGTVLPCGIPCCGDYPQMGDYEDIGARMYWYPTERHLITAVDSVERQRDRQPSSCEGRARRRIWNAQQEQERRDREFDRDAAELFDEAAPAFGGAPLVGYGGSHRPALVEMAERIGIREHPL